MKVENIITRPDGSQVKIVAEMFIGRGLTESIGNYVLRRPTPECSWNLCEGGSSNSKELGMSVAEYIKHGRPEMLQFATPAEILKVNQELVNLSRADDIHLAM